MTIYVDNMFMSARVGRHRSRWCHLITDASDLRELHDFAVSIGLKRTYFQDIPGHPHYDVTEGRRRRAVEAGAVEIDFRDISEILRHRRSKGDLR